VEGIRVHEKLQKLWKIEDYWAVWRSTSRSAISYQPWCSPVNRGVLQVLVEHQLPDVRPDLELDFVLPRQRIM